MSMWDGLGIDPDAAAECGSLLRDSADTIGKEKRMAVEDYISTISANGNATSAINSMNSVRSTLGNYLSVDKCNLDTIISALSKLDSDTAGGY